MTKPTAGALAVVLAVVLVLLAMMPASAQEAEAPAPGKSPESPACLTGVVHEIHGSLAWAFPAGKLLLLRKASMGNNFQECADPFTCELLLCDTDPDSPRDCDEPPVSHCVTLKVQRCFDPAAPPVVRRITLDAVGTCP